MTVKSVLYRLYKWSKVRLNYCLDRIIEFCDMVLMDVYRLPWPAGQDVARRVARSVGDVGWLLRDFPRLPAHKLAGPGWTIVFVGPDPGLQEISHLFFQEKISPQELGRIALWKLSAQTRQWLVEGVDLVVCELGRTYPRAPRNVYTFAVPTWIQQVLTIPGPPEELLAGRVIEGIRRKIKRAQEAGFTYRFSQSKSDFDHFYYRMYLPFIKTRHGDLALLTPYQDQWQRWFSRGGLVLVTQHDKSVAGMLCYVSDHTCFYIEGGILDADPQLFEQSMNAVNIWYAISWAYGQGARVFDLGGTHAWRSNGVFIFKRRWGARVTNRKRVYGTWTFLARDLSLEQRNLLNELGFISEIDGKFYGVWIKAGRDCMTDEELSEHLSSTERQGLDGLVVVSPGAGQTVYNIPA